MKRMFNCISSRNVPKNNVPILTFLLQEIVTLSIEALPRKLLHNEIDSVY